MLSYILLKIIYLGVPNSWIKGKLDPYDNLPDHDLCVYLRILPRLVNYNGSLRRGLTSKGWGSGHDGESLRVEKVVKIQKGYSYRHGRKCIHSNPQRAISLDAFNAAHQSNNDDSSDNYEDLQSMEDHKQEAYRLMKKIHGLEWIVESYKKSDNIIMAIPEIDSCYIR